MVVEDIFNKTSMLLKSKVLTPNYYHFFMTAKAEEDAIIIDDEPMAIENPLAGLEPQATAACTSFDVQLAICKESNIQDPDLNITHRLIKFFEYNRKIEPGREYFCPRKEIDTSQDVELIENEIIIYGYDFMKLKEVKKVFGTTEAIRINPSHFKLIFPDRGTAWKALTMNAKEPATLVGKVESEDSPFPKCWIEMRSYTCNHRIVQAFARFATEKEKEVEPILEDRHDLYRKCSEAYNTEEQRKREEEASREAIKRERIEIRRQNNSHGLYNQYEKNADRNWERGRNNNPGANRDQRGNSRSRSRSKGREPRDNDNASNYSFILGKEISLVNKALGGMQLREKSVIQSDWSVNIPASSEHHASQNVNQNVNQDANLSISLNSSQIAIQNANQNINQNTSSQRGGYNWNGVNADVNLEVSPNWSYKEYQREKEREEEEQRERKRIEVITIDDDN